MDDRTPSYTHWSTCRAYDDGLDCICQEFQRCDECCQLFHETTMVELNDGNWLACSKCADLIAACA